MCRVSDDEPNLASQRSPCAELAFPPVEKARVAKGLGCGCVSAGSLEEPDGGPTSGIGLACPRWTVNDHLAAAVQRFLDLKVDRVDVDGLHWRHIADDLAVQGHRHV